MQSNHLHEKSRSLTLSFYKQFLINWSSNYGTNSNWSYCQTITSESCAYFNLTFITLTVSIVYTYSYHSLNEHTFASVITIISYRSIKFARLCTVYRSSYNIPSNNPEMLILNSEQIVNTHILFQ